MVRRPERLRDVPFRMADAQPLKEWNLLVPTGKIAECSSTRAAARGRRHGFCCHRNFVAIVHVPPPDNYDRRVRQFAAVFGGLRGL